MQEIRNSLYSRYLIMPNVTYFKGNTTLSIMSFSIATLSIMTFIITIRKCDTQHYNNQHNNN